MSKKIIVHRMHSHYFMVLFMIVLDINLIVDNDDLFDWIVPGCITLFGLASLSLIIQGRVWDVALYNEDKGKLVYQRLLKEIAIKKAQELKASEQIYESIQIRSFSAWRTILGILFILLMILISLNDWMWLFEN